jgi:alpha-1,2-mannosyltransferase
MLAYTMLAVLLATLLAAGLTPYTWRLVGRACGAQIKSKTAQRRHLLLERAVNEEKIQQDSGTNSDEEWEKVPASSPPIQPDESFHGVVGFFHPFCNAGGGGEQDTLAAILATQQRYPNSLCVVYTGDHDASKEQIVANVRNRFNIHLNSARVCFLYLSTREHVLPSKWPHFTLLGQSLASILVAWDAFTLLAPDIFIDTMGYAFTLATCKWLFPAVPTGAYVHYPTISTDMLSSLHDDVSSARGAHAGKGAGLRGKAKQFYWELFAKLYSWVGGNVDVVMTNSSWTQNHVSQLWGKSRTNRGKQHAISVVYPPCAVGELQQKIPVDEASEKTRTRNLLYIAQFRPEKCHQMIIDAFRAFLKSYKHLSELEPKPKLILVGSVRDDSDEKRVYKLRLQAQEIKESVEFVVNAKWPQILDYLKTSSVGVNGMWNEHFGIGVVEYQAAGLISVVNDSGGPKVDIVVPIDGKPTGMFPFDSIFNVASLTCPLRFPCLHRRRIRRRLRESLRAFVRRGSRNAPPGTKERREICRGSL